MGVRRRFQHPIRASGGGGTTPTANFTTSITGLALTCTDASTDVGGTIVSYAWTFGDAGTSTAKNPTHTYAAPGTYTVGLTVTDSGTQTASHSSSVTAVSTPVANFTTSIASLAVTCTDTSTDTGATITGWAWTFGDAGTSTTQNPVHTYAAAGTYTIGLTVTDSTGNTASNSHSVTVSSGAGLAAPTQVQIVLQGQNAQGVSAYSSMPNNAYDVPQPNHLTLAWKSVSGAVSYNIYRSVDKGAYAFYANVAAATAATAYSGYVSGSGGFDHSTVTDCAYQDTAATNCVAQVTAPITNFVTPTWGPSHGYTFKVAAVDSGSVEGTMSADCIMIFFAGGKKIMNAGLFNGTLNYTDATVLPTSPLGYTAAAKWTALAYVNAGNTGDPFINPYAGAGACGDNCNVQGFRYIVLNILNSAAGANFNLTPELEGDSTILSSNPYVDPTYGTLAVASTWKQLKIPISDINTYNQGGANNGVLFNEWYKMTMGTTVDCNYWVEYYWSVN